MVDSATNTYIKGLNRDVNKNKYSNETYFDGLNIRVLTDSELSSFTITNERGQTRKFRFPTTAAVYRIEIDPNTNNQTLVVTINGQSKSFVSAGVNWTYENLHTQMIAAAGFQTWIALDHYKIYNNIDHILVVGLDQPLVVLPVIGLVIVPVVVPLTDHRPIGSAQLRDSLIILTVDPTDNDYYDLPTESSNGQIWRLQIDADGSVDGIGASDYLVPSEHLIYNQAMNFSTSSRAEIYANYETPEIGKIYWTDNSNNFRHFNCLTTDPLSTRLSAIEIIPVTEFGEMTIDVVEDGGVYESGMVQYSYQYYNLHGSQTAYAPPTGLVHLTSSSESLPDTGDYLGSAKDIATGKSVTLTLTGLDRRFTNIRIVALHYETKLGTPEISIISERHIPTNGEITLVDSGDLIKGSITNLEFTTIGSINFKCKSVTTKDNIMFPANITEGFYDVDETTYWDSRAYRYNASKVAIIQDSSGNNTTVPADWDVDEEHDCIQTKALQLSTYKYVADGIRLGGEGENVKYYFTLKTFAEDVYGTTGGTTQATKFIADNHFGFTNYANPLNHANYVGYRRDEVYRFGLVFRDELGRKSFVKWVADIKMPAIYEDDLVTTYVVDAVDKTDFNIIYTTSGGTTHGNILHLVFELKNGLPDSAVSWEVVRVKREDYDKTIKSQGILFGVNANRPDYYYAPPSYTSAAGLIGKNGLLFASPEVTINGDSFDACDVQPILSYEPSSYDDTYGGVHDVSTYKFHKLHSPSTSSTIAGTNYSIIDHRIVHVGYDATYSITGFGKPYRHYRYSEPGSRHGYAGTACVMSLDSTITASSVIYGADILSVNIIKELSAQYGGASYSARYANEYIACTQQTDENTLDVFGGDIYISYFDYLYGIYDIGEGAMTPPDRNSCYPIYFPVESELNLTLRHDYSQVHSYVTGNGSYLMQETGGVHAEGVYTYNQTTDLYLYNPAYSRENDTSIYLAKPIDFSNNVEFDVRIQSSESKIVNEETDSWLQYLATNYTDVDGTYGGINKIKSYRNRVVFIQDKAIGWAAVNERSLITPDASATSLSLGKGGILDQYFYISRHAGTTHQFSVVDTPNALYYYDSVNNRINMFTGDANTPISELKGIGSYLKEMGLDDIKTTDTTIAEIGVHGVYDQRFNRILWTFKDLSSPNEFTIGYNEMLQAFESFYSFKPTIYMNFNDKVYSMSPTSPNDGYQHNLGNYGEFYGSFNDSHVEILMNKDPYRTKIITNLEYYLNTLPDNLYNFSTIRVYNDYQDTGDVTVTSSNGGRRMRTWRYTVPRNSGATDRIRGEYALINLNFNNERPVNTKFTLSDLITHYIPRSL